MTLVAREIAVRLGERRAIDGISLSVPAGRLVGVVGPNGAGKSTLLRALAGLAPLAAGSVQLEVQPGSRNLADLSARDRARAIAYLPQDRTVHWPLAIRALVGLGRLPHRGASHTGNADDISAIASAMAAMQIGHLAERPADAVSGGELARALVARALAQEASTLIADEPTAGLDPAHALGLFEVLTRLAAEGRTIVVAVHELSLAARFCHAVVMLANGRAVASGAPDDVLTAERLSRVYGVRMGIGVVEGTPVVVPLGPVVGGDER